MFEIAESVYLIPLVPRQGVNAYLIGDVLVDAGVRFSANRLLRALDRHPLSAHLLTHAHPDHQGASAVVCAARNIPLWCHAAEKSAAESGDVTADYAKPGSLMARAQMFFAGPGHPVARTVSEGDEITGFRVVETPGHTAGHISLWREADGTLIAGDAAVGMNLLTTMRGLDLPLKIATIDMEAAKVSIRMLADLSPRRVAFGHGPVASGADFIAFARSL